LAQGLQTRGGPADLVEALVALAWAVDAGEAITVVVGVADPERALSSQEVADLLNVSRPHVVKLARDGVLPFHRVGNRHRFRATDILAYDQLESGRRTQILAGLAPEDGYCQEDF
jgi:excisionase family DNA binding protein